MNKENLIQDLQEIVDKLLATLSALKEIPSESRSEGEVKSGPYSDGFYVDGSIDASYNQKTPQQAKDNGLWYSYIDGTPELAHYLAHLSGYSNYAFWEGVINYAGYNPVPTQAWDDGKWYNFEAGVAVAAEGAYSVGSFVAGEPDLQGKYNGEQVAKDDGQTRNYQNGLVI